MANLLRATRPAKLKHKLEKQTEASTEENLGLAAEPDLEEVDTPLDADDEDLDEDSDDEEVLPGSPRFCATLSPEAQYAMMRGYEDRIVKHLSRRHPETHVDTLRASTPQSDRVVLVRKNHRHLDEKKDGRSEEEEAGICCHVAKQVGVSRKFQAAIDLLDNLDGGNEIAATKAITQRRVRNPIQKYKIWSKGWKNDFRLEGSDIK